MMKLLRQDQQGLRMFLRPPNWNQAGKYSMAHFRFSRWRRMMCSTTTRAGPSRYFRLLSINLSPTMDPHNYGAYTDIKVYDC